MPLFFWSPICFATEILSVIIRRGDGNKFSSHGVYYIIKKNVIATHITFSNRPSFLADFKEDWRIAFAFSSPTETSQIVRVVRWVQDVSRDVHKDEESSKEGASSGRGKNRFLEAKLKKEESAKQTIYNLHKFSSFNMTLWSISVS